MEESKHKKFMRLALIEAQTAFQKREVPVGSVIVRGDLVLSRSHNFRERDQDPLSHAEILAIKKASQKTNSWRLDECCIYISLEPCLMCLGAILQSRISQLFYSCPDLKRGSFSFYGVAKSKNWNHKIKIRSGLYASESSLLLKRFFKDLR